MNVLENVINKLEGVSQQGNSYQALCPAHDDKKPSLSIATGDDGRVLLHCHAGCKTEDIVKELGLEMKDLFPQNNKKQKRKVKTIYSYYSENNELLYQVVRTEPKGFFQRRPDDKGGWINKLKGIKTVLYKLPYLKKAIQNKEIIFFVEGEKDVDTLFEMALTATTIPMGAGKWKEHYREFLRDANVVILPDNDKPGKDHAKDVATSLTGIASSVKILDLPGLQEKGDVTDWFNAGGTTEELKRLAEEAEEWSPQAITETCFRENNCTDLGNALRFVEIIGSDVRYCYQRKKWLYWNGTHWQWDYTGEIMRKAKDVVRSIYAEASVVTEKDKRKEIADWAMKSESESRIKAMVKLAESELPITVSDLDRSNWLLNVKNGTIDLKTGELKNHCKTDFITKIAPVIYDPNAKSEIFNKFLERILPDVEVREFVQKAAGYSITGDVSEEKLFFAYGPPATGKSTFLVAVGSTLGDYAATADFEAFLAKGGSSGIRNDIARLEGKRFVQSVEVDEGKKLAEGLVKQLTGGDVVTARFLHQEFFEFVPTFKLWMAANFRPRINDNDAAMWRRILQVPFDQHIPAEERDPNIKLYLRDPEKGGPAVLKWLVDGCLMWQKEGLTVPAAVSKATKEYQQEMDPLSDFIEDCCVLYSHSKVSNSSLWQAYEDWCKDNGERYPIGRKKFKQRLEDRGFTQYRTNFQRFWSGIGLASHD